MWPRVAELMIGVWLVISPLIFRGTVAVGEVAVASVMAGAAVAGLSLLSFWRRTPRAHLFTAALAAALALYAYLGWERPGPPIAQNTLTAALLLILLGIVPNHASQPPEPWRRVDDR